MIWNRAAVALSLIASAFCFAADDAIPPEIGGVWANDQAAMNGAALMSGQALYLGRDGTGAFVGGPPAIGFKITAIYHADTSELELTAHDGAQQMAMGRLKYDAQSKTLTFVDHSTMHKRFDELTDEMRKGLGLR